jgi:hypothetical protein
VSNLVTAWAALFAAATSIVTLIATTMIAGRREQRMWVREALTDAFIAFLDASWRSSDALHRCTGLDPADAARDQHLGAARLAYEEMRTLLTRLRLIATPDVVESGHRLLKAQRLAIENSAREDGAALLERASAGRRALLVVAKAEMGLRHRHSYPGTDWPLSRLLWSSRARRTSAPREPGSDF